MKRNLNSLKRLISDFHKINPKSEMVLNQLIDQIIFFENRMECVPFLNDKIRTAQLRVAVRTYGAGSIFVRARKIDSVLSAPTIQDFWEPPAKVAKKFRLNWDGEAVLYVTCDTSTAKKETDINPGDIYNLSFYRLVAPIEVTELAFRLRGKQTVIERTIETFVRELLSTPGAKIYDISNVIAKRYLDLSIDGWVYPSVANKKGENLCLKLDAKKKLNLIGAFSFCNGVPIASYDTVDSSQIKVSGYEEAKNHWNGFVETSNVFGKMKALDDPAPLSLVKVI